MILSKLFQIEKNKQKKRNNKLIDIFRSDFSRNQAQVRSPGAPFSPPNEKNVAKSKKTPFEEEEYEVPKGRSDRRGQDRSDDRETRRQTSR